MSKSGRENKHEKNMSWHAGNRLSLGNKSSPHHLTSFNGQQSMAHSNNQTNHTGFVTMGVTEEMQDSVHSLISPNRGYFEWKADHRSSTYNEGR